MKLEPRPAVHMEKHLFTAVNWVGLKLRYGTCLLALGSAHISVWEKAVSKLSLDVRHFISSLYATGAFQADTWFWSSEGVSLSKSVCGFFKRN